MAMTGRSPTGSGSRSARAELQQGGNAGAPRQAFRARIGTPRPKPVHATAGRVGAAASPAGRARAGLAVFAVLSTIAGCSGAAKRETSALYDAVDRYRGADDSAKLVRGQAVAALACTVASVCDVKRVCLAAIDPTTRALQLKDEVAKRVGDIEKNHLEVASSEAQALSGKLDEAAKLLEAGHLKMSDCERRLIDLRARNGG